jgi:tetratricopeptide (TPR) repeat protein
MKFKVKLFLILFYCFNCLHLNAQDKTIDSLKLVLKNAKHDSVKIITYQYLSEIDNEENLEKYVDAAAELIDKQLSSLYKNSSAFISMERYKAANLENLGLVEQNKGNLTKSLDANLKALQIREQIKDSSGIGSSLNNIGLVYATLNDIKKASDFYKRSYAICKKSKNKKMAAYALNGIADIYLNEKSYDKALEIYFQSLIIKNEINDKYGSAYALNNIGVVYKRMNQMDSALLYFKKSLVIREEINDRNGIAYSYINIARTYVAKNNLKEAEINGIKALNISKEVNFPNIIRYSADVLQNVYEKQNNYKKAYEMVLISKEMSEIIVNDDTEKELLKKEMQYNFDKKNIADSIKTQAEKNLNTLKFKQEKNQRYYLYSGLTITLLFSILMFRRFRISQKQKNIIEEQKLLVESQKFIVEEKQKEILDSIRYAKRIQESLLPTETYIDRNIRKLKQ